MRDLLLLLDPDPDVAAQRYLELRTKLVRFFEWRRCRDAEDLAHETLKRGMGKVASGTQIFSADPGSYFLGIARNLVKESWTPTRLYQATDEFLESQASHAPPPDRQVEMRLTLRKGLDALTPVERNLLMRYYDGERTTLQAELRINDNALRVRIHRLTLRVRRAIDGPGPETAK